MTNKTQLRGHCPHCGRQQAVLASGLMSQHGYTVDHGYFSGVCGGYQHQPMEVSRTACDDICDVVRREIAENLRAAADLEAGTTEPVRAPTDRFERDLATRRSKRVWVPYAEATPRQQREARERLIHERRGRAASGEHYVAEMQALQDKVLGQPLLVVEKGAPPPRPTVGERRASDNGVVLVATSIEGQRVYWKREDNGRRGWSGFQSWRAMSPV